jgi:hypothetical protein
MRFFSTLYFKLFAVVILVFIFYQECVVKNNKDFDVFIGASRLIFDKQNCYDVWLKSGSEGLKYFYSPLFAVLLFPLKSAPQFFYNLIWLSLNLFLIFRTFSLLSFFLPLHKFSKIKFHGFVLLVLICSLRFILDNLDLGQMTFFLVWGSLECMRLIFQKKHLTGALLLALLINIKIIPIALLAYLIYKKDFRVVLLTLLFSVFFLYLPSIFIGTDFNNELLHSWFTSLKGTSVNSIHDDAGRPSLSSLIPSLVMDTEILFSVKRNFISLDADSAHQILNGFRCLLLVFLCFLFGRPFQKIITKKFLFYDLSLICLATPIVFPHQGKYSFLYLLPAYAYTLYSLIRMQLIKTKYKSTYLRPLIFMLLSFTFTTLTTDGLIGRRLSDFTEYLHLITYGAFFLLFALICLKPKKL